MILHALVSAKLFTTALGALVWLHILMYSHMDIEVRLRAKSLVTLGQLALDAWLFYVANLVGAQLALEVKNLVAALGLTGKCIFLYHMHCNFVNVCNWPLQ